MSDYLKLLQYLKAEVKKVKDLKGVGPAVKSAGPTFSASKKELKIPEDEIFDVEEPVVKSKKKKQLEKPKAVRVVNDIVVEEPVKKPKSKKKSSAVKNKSKIEKKPTIEPKKKKRKIRWGM